MLIKMLFLLLVDQGTMKTPPGSRPTCLFPFISAWINKWRLLKLVKTLVYRRDYLPISSATES
nr:hypothetical protein Q903MT_gene179 [Picea sitchensis]